MTVRFMVATPTPHYNYTLRYNHQLENTKHLRDTDKIKTSQTKWEDFYSDKRKRIEEQHRIHKAHQRKVELEQVHQYEVLDNRRSYSEYRYMFYVGTQFDTYI